MDARIYESITLDEELVQECWAFANDYKENYHLRGQHDRQKKIMDCHDGKIAEWIVYHRLKPFFCDLTQPDMKLYKKGEKSWKSDLFAADGVLEFAVKACRRLGNDSWIFQREDENGMGRDEGIYSPDACDKLIIGVTIENRVKQRSEEDELRISLPSMSGAIRTVLTLYEVRKRNLLEEPWKEELREYKDAMYYNSCNQHGFKTGIIHPTVTELVEQAYVGKVK